MLRHSVDDNGELEMLKVLSRQGAGVTAGTQAGVKTHKARTGINGNGNGNGNGNNKAGPGLTWSEKGFRWVLKQLNKGVDDAQIAAGLHALFVVPHPLQKHAQDPHWIPRTIFNAKAIRAGSPLRYTSS